MKSFLYVLPIAAVTALGGCTTNPVTGYPTLDPNFVDAVQADVAAACQYIPTAISIASDVAALIPGAGTIVTTVGNGVAVVSRDLCTAVPPPATPASASLHAQLRASSPNNPVMVGTTAVGVRVTGYKVH